MYHRKIINQIKRLDLSQYPYQELTRLQKELGYIGVVVTNLHPGKRILRARINREGERFHKISDLSYKPQEFNTVNQRASTPFKTMFYGSIVPEIRGINEPETAVITTLLELSDFARSNQTTGAQIFTFSAWQVMQDIQLISLIYYQDFQRPTALSTKLQAEYKAYISQYPALKVPSLEVSRFLGEQFAKEIIRHDYDYLISATYSEIITGLGYNGVLYPSVRLAGEGINIAITPDAVNTKLAFIGAGERTVYKNKTEIFVGNDTITSINSDGTLEHHQPPAKDFVSEEFGWNKVGLGLI